MSDQAAELSLAAIARARNGAHRRFGIIVLALIGLGFLAVLTAGVYGALLIRRTQVDSRWVEHTFLVQQKVQGIALDLQTMRTARVLNRMRYRNAAGTIEARIYDRAYADSRMRISELAKLTADNPRQGPRLARIRLLVARYTQMTAPGAFPGDAEPPPRLTNSLVANIQSLTDAMFQEEAHLLGLRIANQRQSIAIFWIVLTVAGVLVVLVAIGSVAVIHRYTIDLARSRAELEQMNHGLEDAVRERTADLQRANDEIQRFAYIVSHDLRSPLVNVLGFTSELAAALTPLDTLVTRVEQQAPDLVDEDARRAVREDLPEAIGFIRSSTQKMDRLINAILRLSREGMRTISRERIDMDALVDGVIGALRYRIDEEGIRVTVAPNLPALFSDRLAIEQIVSNLVENAVKYLKRGRPGEIGITGRREGSRLIFEVIDNGRGIDPKDHSRIFDLFRRSGPQDQPGEGIGLAHVRALVQRLGGTIDVRSVLDQGASFILTFPAFVEG
ncbi:sensor histidine kinase [Sphingomonas bacterium]|uniref:sensor histidine kinase n=1 Tax=Sphingomonas bacterium TaxID=1895847 RepID=UPI001575ED99|nr:ATP-binding protein [Sphingomonas bacterium]